MRHCAVAIFTDGKLERAFLVKNPEAKARGPVAWVRMADAVAYQLLKLFGGGCQTLVVEQQQIYRQTRNPADIQELTGVTGALVGRLAAVEYVGYLPRAWKGNVDADAFTARLELRLTPAEKAVIEPCAASLRHNCLDAIGLGKFHLGRRA